MTIFVNIHNALIDYFVQAAYWKNSIVDIKWILTSLILLSLCMNRKWVSKWRAYPNRRIFMITLPTVREEGKCTMILLMLKSKSFNNNSMIWPNPLWKLFKISGLRLLVSLKNLKAVMLKLNKWWLRKFNKHLKIVIWLNFKLLIKLWLLRTVLV